MKHQTHCLAAITLATVILLTGVPQKAKSEEVKTLNNDASGLFTTHNRIVPGLAQDDIRLRDEQARLAKEKEKKETMARKVRIWGKNTYAPGNCTFYAKSKSKVVENGWGDARFWPTNSTTPMVGGVIKTSESWRGHVAVVEQVKTNSIVVSEMNYKGLYRISYREIPLTAKFIRGYIN